jgi:hypothetical protein
MAYFKIKDGYYILTPRDEALVLKFLSNECYPDLLAKGPRNFSLLHIGG